MQHEPTSIISSARHPFWLTQVRNDGYIHIHIPRNTLIAGAISLLLHALLLLFLSRQHLLDQNTAEPVQPGPLVVNLQHPPPHVEAPVPPIPEAAPPPPVQPPRRLAQKPRILPSPRHITPPPVIAKKEASEFKAPVAPAPLASPPVKPAPLDPSKFPDMAAYVNAMREQRHLAGLDADRVNEEAIAHQRPPPPSSGTNGVFNILSMDAHSARVAFLGWKGEYSYSRREVYEVNANIGEDIHRMIIRKMIEIIRRYYDGDFNWESQRLGRIVVLSARLRDNDGLEDFLLKEFFEWQGAQY